jgi:hypothetical protein
MNFGAIPNTKYINILKDDKLLDVSAIPQNKMTVSAYYNHKYYSNYSLDNLNAEMVDSIGINGSFYIKFNNCMLQDSSNYSNTVALNGLFQIADRTRGFHPKPTASSQIENYIIGQQDGISYGDSKYQWSIVTDKGTFYVSLIALPETTLQYVGGFQDYTTMHVAYIGWNNPPHIPYWNGLHVDSSAVITVSKDPKGYRLSIPKIKLYDNSDSAISLSDVNMLLPLTVK